jgi:hypothetical protein
MKHQPKHALKRLAVAVALTLSGSAAYALPTLTTPEGVVDPFGGFDWNSAGSAMVAIPGGTLTSGQTITTTFMSNAVQIQFAGGAAFPTADLYPVNPTPTYEYTIYSTITETVACGAVGTVCGTTATFTATGGNFTIFFDTTPDSNLVTGAGVTDGIAIISGNILTGGGTFDAAANNCASPGGRGDFTFSGAVTSTNPTFVSALSGTTAASTLQIGGCTTNWTQPTSFAALSPPGGTQPISGLLFQADANQTFRALPEPGSLAVFGLVLGVVSVFSRKQRK